MRHLLFVIFTCIAFGASYGCSSGSKMSGDQNDSIELPTMVTNDVSMLISDSGVIKYKVLSPIWFVYENDVTNKYWYFPEGIIFNQIDSTFSTEFSLKADTAYNYETKQVWHLINNVEVHSVQGEYFRSNDLFWDLRKHEVYTDSFIHIERPDATIEGYGFTSNDAFTKYEIRQTSGIFPFRDDMKKKQKAEVDTLQEAGAIAEESEDAKQEQ